MKTAKTLKLAQKRSMNYLKKKKYIETVDHRKKKERKFILHSDGNFIKLQAGRLLSHRAQSSLGQSCEVL